MINILYLGVRCSSYDVLQALVSQLKYLKSLPAKNSMSLKYLDFSNCFGILSKFLHLLPNLEEIRVGSDAPPKMRQTTKRLLVDDSHLVSNENLQSSLNWVFCIKNISHFPTRVSHHSHAFIPSTK